MPTVSVLMSVYNEPLEWVKESIDSILTQTFSDFEFVIINDNPARAELAEFLEMEAKEDPRIRIHANPKNIGLTKSLNIGLKLCTGKYIARMDADDISMPERLTKQYELMESNPAIGVCGSFIRMFGTEERLISYPEKHEDCFLFFDSPFAHPCVMIRRDILVRNNIGYNPEFKCAQDFDLWERLYPITKFANIPEVLLHYRKSKSQISTNKASEQYRYSTSIKGRSFNRYCETHDIDLRLKHPIDLNQVKAYRKAVSPTVRFNRNKLLSYLYRSIKTKRLISLGFMIFSGDVFRFSFIDGMKTVWTLAFLPGKAPFIT